MPIDLIDELKWRGLFHQCTDEQALRAHLSSKTRHAYVGYDPTADSLTIGNLVTIMMLVHFQRSGHEPVVVMGGGTGLIGDPSGKSAERTLQTEQMVRNNVEKQRPIFSRLFANAAEIEGRPARVPPIVNNIDWLGKLGYIEALRDIGKYFSVNMMIQKDSVRERLHNRDQGISYTEFSYMILQSYDYYVLFRDHAKYGVSSPVTLQMGGSDQWGNIVGGADLIRRINAGTEGGEDRAVAFGLTAPLVTKADGTKFGKTETGAIWLTPERTSPYAYYQFWLNAADADVSRFLRVFTLLPKERIETIEAEHAKDPGQRIAQRELARAATRMLHGSGAVEQAEGAAKALFAGDIAALPREAMLEALSSAPGSTHERGLLDAGLSLVEFLVSVKLAASKRESREFLQNGSVTVNGRKAGPEDRLTAADLLHGSFIALRRGKKNWHLTTWA